MSITDVWLIILILAVAVMATALLVEYRRRKRLLLSLNHMLEQAIDGNFQASGFDESLHSAVEVNLADFLHSAQVTEKQIREERDNIQRLIADISHQTKTPVANILLYTQLLRECALSAKAAAYAEELELQGERLGFLIDALVKTSRLETGVFQMNPQAREVEPLLKAAEERIRGEATRKYISVSLFPTTARACFDEKWTGEALDNLLDNAVKYTDVGGKITIRAEAYELFCRIDVEDTGCGIAEEEFPKIFRRFYRSAEISQTEGLGIGLYLVRVIAERQGGYVKVASVWGKGSCFSLFLPREKREPVSKTRSL